MVTTIQLDESIKSKLDILKTHHRETYNDLLKRLLERYEGGDNEALVDTIEVMGDAQKMRDLAQAMDDFKKGKFKSLAHIEQELGITD
ncbi:hypothetical protein EXS73_01620 [Candidatus Pacearchaeota archaeon]|nr:hypothetical protein [Candidatus Pacearchaeota archaeon]